MRDKQYFDDKVFGFTNSKLKATLTEISKEQDKPIYLVIDEALRAHVKNQGKEFNVRPKIPILT